MYIEVFEKKLQINIDNKKIEEVLKREFSGYFNKNINKNIDIEINFITHMNIDELYSNSPSIHYTFKNGFLLNFGKVKIKFIQNDNLKIYIHLNTKTNFLSKFRSIDYRNSIDTIGLVLHELIFIPMTFFDDNMAPIHASSMKSSNNKVRIFGGTGGVGKTSLELLLCRELGYSFISDDIAIISNELKIYPNLSYPKIYAYNVVNNDDLKNILFEDSSVVNKFQWKVFKKLKGDNRVRRSISPYKIFNSVENKPNTIDEYYILSRTNSVKNIKFVEIDYKKASKMTLDIMKNEYHSVLQHIVWHEYNAELINISPVLRIENIYKNWYSIYNNIFKKVKCKIIKIPVDMKHDEFLIQMKNQFSE